ncbi:zinc finger protein 845-like isoform X2 [Cotesia glomerata]|uniref:zinc finger protein 845-like isoform X2 n=1 Tax=Cotesia glomerata TaxID=32391 RepID=UPI001D01F680|nr:zinc finger protein 845-like isoform X2 [Cotesia glomerata]
METSYDDEDDTHYCIKCHVTITGLENYIQHRQTNCRQLERKAVTPDPTVCYPEILNADAFFSSLELQSSSKTKPSGSRALAGLEPEKKSERLRGKRNKAKRYNEIEEPSAKEKLIALSPVVADLDDPTDHIGIPSLVGFPDLVVPFNDKSTSKLTVTSTLPKHVDELDKSKRDEEDRDQWLNDDLDEDSDTNKDTAGDESDSESDYRQRNSEDDSDESPVEDIGQEDSYSETDDQEDREYPPQPHTGGKWKPEQMLEHIAEENDDELDQDEAYHQDSLVPPPHTGGKWKPSEKTVEDEPAEFEEKEEDKEEKERTMTRNSREPPPGHTRGKWIPGASVTPSELRSGYWCSPCGRKLASKLVYSRHLRSDLHARRSIQEIEGDVKLPRSAGPLLRKKTRTKRQKVIALKRSTELKKTVVDNKPSKKTRRREKEILRCEMCHARVRRPQLGKHLLSHYHCRVAGLNPCSPTARRFILENMVNVVHQCPFRCTNCRFYCNTEETFLRHWRSSHANVPIDFINFLKEEKNYTCVCCNFWCNGESDMEQHLLSKEHRETISMINGSVPIVIRRQLILSCETCNRGFRYNIQLQHHANETGHPLSWTATDEYQQRIQCPLCPQVLRSQVALQRHQLTAHKKKVLESKDEEERGSIVPYFCSFCSVNFETARDAVLHRRTPNHKQTVKEHKFSSQGVLPSRKDCGQCGDKFNNLTDYKRHLLKLHTDSCHKCLRCGELFALPQDLTKHTKERTCGKITQILENESRCVDGARKCLQCPFRTDSEAELIFHQALHAGTVEIYSEKPGSSKTPPTYRCPVCQKIFSKASLRFHILRHTREKPYRCSKCMESFSRKSALTVHVTECHPFLESEASQRIKNFLCLHCNTGFYTKNNLRQHMLRHVGKEYKCEVLGCPTVLRNEAELRTHKALVHAPESVERKFKCNECSYSSKTKSQLRRHYTRHQSPDTKLKCPKEDCKFITRLHSHLKRHIRVHTGAKPYKCPHCPYASNNIENLRKHILSTRLHPGKTIYECEKCKIKGSDIYVTNFSKELRAHLVSEHSEEFPTAGHANSYVAGIFAGDGHSEQPE